MVRRKVEKNSDPVTVRMSAASRELPGWWSTLELTELLSNTKAAVNLQVRRGKLVPTITFRGAFNLFSDEEVYRYLSNPGKPGRPKREAAS